MEKLDWLVARAEIADVISSYAILFDDQRWDDFADLWTDDASFEVDDQGFFGKEAVLEFLSTCLPKGYASKHMISPPLVEIGADGLTAKARTDVVWITPDFRNKIVARYNDELERGDDGRWRFRRRWETPVPYSDAPIPMSEDALTMSRSTMRTDS
jgi:uncharacterized protein (TIGR02246 family)